MFTIFAVIWMTTSTFALKSQVLRHPESQTRLVGDVAVLKCKLSNVPAHDENVVQWTRNGLGLGYKLGGKSLDFLFISLASSIHLQMLIYSTKTLTIFFSKTFQVSRSVET